MNAIIVDDELLMLKSFNRLCTGIDDLNIAGSFQSPEEALLYTENNPVDLAVLDIAMPGMNGIQLAEELRHIYPDILIVFITAYDEYVREANQIDADYYIMKPYKQEVLVKMMARMKLLSRRQESKIQIQTFGRFNVIVDGDPIPLNGKAKEILALVITRRGTEISNEEIYTTLWENREYSNVHMKVYYNALKRLKDVLKKYGISDILKSTFRGQMLNVSMVDCDYYAWLDGDKKYREQFPGKFMSEYTWGEYLLAEMVHAYYE